MAVIQADINARASAVGFTNLEITRMTPLVRAIVWFTIAFETGFITQTINTTTTAAASTAIADADTRIADAQEAA